MTVKEMNELFGIHKSLLHLWKGKPKYNKIRQLLLVLPKEKVEEILKRKPVRTEEEVRKFYFNPIETRPTGQYNAKLLLEFFKRVDFINDVLSVNKFDNLFTVSENDKTIEFVFNGKRYEFLKEKKEFKDSRIEKKEERFFDPENEAIFEYKNNQLKAWKRFKILEHD